MVYRFYILLLCVFFAACSSNKALVKNKISNADSIIDVDYDLYIQADAARIIGDEEKAKLLFQKFLAKNPKNAPANYYYGMLLVREGDNKGVAYLNNAYFLEPTNILYKEAYATALIFKNNVGKGTQLMLELANTNKANAREYIYKTFFLLEQTNNLNKALEIAEIAEKKFGFDDDLAQKKMRVYDRNKNNAGMLLEVNKLIAYDPNVLKYYLLKISLLRQLKLEKDLEPLYQKLSNKFGNEAEAINVLLANAEEKKDTVSINRLTQVAIKNKYIDPLAKMELLWPNVTKALQDTNQKESVLATFTQVYESASANNKVKAAYARVLDIFGRSTEAIALYEQLLAVDSNAIEHSVDLMNLYLSTSQLDKTISTANQVLKNNSTVAIMYLYLGQAYTLKEKLDTAYTYYRTGLLLADRNTGMQESFLGSMAEVCNTQKKFVQSDSLFEEALNLNPNNATNLNNYAYYLSVRNERLRDAASMSLKSLSISPNNKTFLDTYAWILYKQNKLEAAAEKMLEALNAEGDTDAVMLEHYGDMLFKLNRKEEALTYWNKALNKDQNLPNLKNKITYQKLYE